MNDYEFKSNSHKAKAAQQNTQPEKKPIEKVVTGKVKVEKNKVHKFTDIFIAEDIENVKSYLLMDVLVPTIRNTIVDMIINGAQMIFLGRTGGRGSRYPADKYSYTKYYKGDNRQYEDAQVRTRHSYDNITIESRGEAEMVLDRLIEQLEDYGMVSIADLYQLVGITAEHTDYKYGWTDLRRAEVIRTRDGYQIKLPRAVVLN